MNVFLLSLDNHLNKNTEKKKIDTIKKYIMDLSLLIDDKKFVYFPDVVFKIIKYNYGKEYSKTSKVIKKSEDTLQKSIQSKIDNFIKIHEPHRMGNYTLITHNPLTTHLYFKVSYSFLKQFIS